MDRAVQARTREASQLASEAMALIESIGDATLTVGLSRASIYAKLENTEFSEGLRWSQRVIDLADGDPSKGGFMVGSPLALAFTTRALTRYHLGRPGWRDDQAHGLAMARSADPYSYATAVTYVYLVGIAEGVLTPDDHTMHEIEDALRIAERSGDDLALRVARMTLGVALLHREHGSRARPRAAAPGRDQRRVPDAGNTSWASYRSSTCTWRVSGLGVEISMARYRSSAPPPTIGSSRDVCLRGAFQRRVFWWRHCSSAAPKVTRPKPKPRSRG